MFGRPWEVEVEVFEVAPGARVQCQMMGTGALFKGEKIRNRKSGELFLDEVVVRLQTISPPDGLSYPIALSAIEEVVWRLPTVHATGEMVFVVRNPTAQAQRFAITVAGRLVL